VASSNLDEKKDTGSSSSTLPASTAEVVGFTCFGEGLSFCCRFGGGETRAVSDDGGSSTPSPPLRLVDGNRVFHTVGRNRPLHHSFANSSIQSGSETICKSYSITSCIGANDEVWTLRVKAKKVSRAKTTWALTQPPRRIFASGLVDKITVLFDCKMLTKPLDFVPRMVLTNN